MTLLEVVNGLGSQEDFVSHWEPAASFVEDPVSGAKIVAPCLLDLAAAHLPLFLQWGDGPVHSQLALLWYLLNLLFCEQVQLCLRLELFVGNFSLSLFFPLSLWLSHSLGCCLTLAPSDCHQGIQAWSLP